MALLQNIVILLLTFVAVSRGLRVKNEGCRKPPNFVNIRVRQDNVIDLTYIFDEDTPAWPGFTQGFKLFEIFKGWVRTPFCYYYEGYTFSSPEHLGTHMDAPSHFAENTFSAGEVPLQNLMGHGVLLNMVTDEGERMGADSLVTTEDFLAWEKKQGHRIRSGSIVLIRTGFGDVYHDREKYFGTNLTGSEALPLLHFPGIDPEAAEWLVKSRCIAAIGLDTPSVDYGQAREYRSHQMFCSNNIPIFENVANLDQVAARNTRGFSVIALPYKIMGGSGAPVRIVAVLR